MAARTGLSSQILPYRSTACATAFVGFESRPFNLDLSLIGLWGPGFGFAAVLLSLVVCDTIPPPTQIKPLKQTKMFSKTCNKQMPEGPDHCALSNIL